MLCYAQGSIKRNSVHQASVYKELWFAAHFPDALIKILPVRFSPA
jgi:hypothetical protein